MRAPHWPEESSAHGGPPGSSEARCVQWEDGIPGLAEEALGSLGDLFLALELVRSSVLGVGGEEPRPHSGGSGTGPGLEERPSGKTEMD